MLTNDILAAGPTNNYRYCLLTTHDEARGASIAGAIAWARENHPWDSIEIEPKGPAGIANSPDIKEILDRGLFYRG